MSQDPLRSPWSIFQSIMSVFIHIEIEISFLKNKQTKKIFLKQHAQ